MSSLQGRAATCTPIGSPRCRASVAAAIAAERCRDLPRGRLRPSGRTLVVEMTPAGKPTKLKMHRVARRRDQVEDRRRAAWPAQRTADTGWLDPPAAERLAKASRKRVLEVIELPETICRNGPGTACTSFAIQCCPPTRSPLGRHCAGSGPSPASHLKRATRQSSWLPRVSRRAPAPPSAASRPQ